MKIIKYPITTTVSLHLEATCFHFFRLPGELRNLVCEHTIPHCETRQALTIGKESLEHLAVEVAQAYALACANKQTRAEYLPMLVRGTACRVSLQHHLEQYITFTAMAPLIPRQVHFDVSWPPKSGNSPPLDIKVLINLCEKNSNIQVRFFCSPVEALDSAERLATSFITDIAHEIHCARIARDLNSLFSATLRPVTKDEKRWKAFYDKAVSGIDIETNLHQRGARPFSHVSIRLNHSAAQWWMYWGGGNGLWVEKLRKFVKEWMLEVALPGTWGKVTVQDSTVDLREWRFVDGKYVFAL